MSLLNNPTWRAINENKAADEFSDKFGNTINAINSGINSVDYVTKNGTPVFENTELKDDYDKLSNINNLELNSYKNSQLNSAKTKFNNYQDYNDLEIKYQDISLQQLENMLNNSTDKFNKNVDNNNNITGSIFTFNTIYIAIFCWLLYTITFTIFSYILHSIRAFF